MSTSLFSQTPWVNVTDNRGLTVRSITYYRHPDSPQATDERTTFYQYNACGFLKHSADPRLQGAGLVNIRRQTDLAGRLLHKQSTDAGTTVCLDDAAGRPFITISNIRTADDGTQDISQAVSRTFVYEDATLPGRPLSMTEQVNGEATCISDRFVYAGNTDAERALNLAGQCISHYDTAGLIQTDSIALTRVPLSVTRRLLKDANNPDTVADWQGQDASVWNDLLASEAYNMLTATDATGMTLTTTDAQDNVQRVAYDVAGRQTGSWLRLRGANEQVIVKSLTYSAAGQKLREEHGNGVVTTYQYEPETQRLLGIKTERPAGHASGAKVLQDLRYEYDPVGNVLSIRNDAEETRFWRNQKVVPENTYTYDSLYQLVSGTGREMANAGQQGSSLPSPNVPLPTDSSAYTTYTRTYTYDNAGNLTLIRHSAPATNNNYTQAITVSDRSNRGVSGTLAEIPSQVDALFTAGGQQKYLQPGQRLSWTARNELLQVTLVAREGDADDRECYRYDTSSQRILKVIEQKANNIMQMRQVIYLPGLELRTTNSGGMQTENLQVICLGEAGRAQVRIMHWVEGKPADLANDQIRYSYDNLNGSSVLELDSAGNIISAEEYYPYGGTAVWSARSQVEANYKTLRYSGKERDASGLYYYGYRYYQPWVGRWLSVDPAGTIDGLNMFRMCRNNPVTLTDYDGLAPHPRTRLGEGPLYEPKLSTGKDRDLPGALSVISATPVSAEVTGTPIKLGDVLNDEVMKSIPLLTDLINPAKMDMDDATKKILTHPDRIGDILAFSAIHISVNENDNIHALRIVDSKTSDYQKRAGATLAYWAPQGGHVDIPAHPQKGQPELVFTPGFSGCTFVADKLDENTLRVRHVQGGKEDTEYNDLAVNEHGQGMIDAMEYRDYGYHMNGQEGLMENISGSAFMIYEEGQWNIKYQSLANAPGILSVKEDTAGLFKKRQYLKVGMRHIKGGGVVNNGAISLRH